ncbi:beta-N-acetylhexosaminidase [Thalassotalea agarivorans]|uniref:Beta-hexosaminidase n=1 Tax=Thalassotalea agarivorans TaxID=349064 RepID=A0A1I0GUL0_THASX|nr:beta-N-acetylhexosaminidase [Thalassotalea agarivorans]SET75040.1 beta-N-acetylhexosaminidase [Thalassotalea agarivorans]
MIGPLMVDVQGTTLTEEDKEIIAHPLVGGLIIFSRNYQSLAQLQQLCQDIRRVKPSILIAADQEGGRVQRFREEFTAVPAMGKLSSLAPVAGVSTEELARACGRVIAYEVANAGLDISFAPVLDIDNISDVIGDRGFANNPQHVQALASAFIAGLTDIGMAATGKHFPGHGNVKADSHVAQAIDNRTRDDIFNHDMTVFSALIKQNKLAAMMPAHVIYPAIDNHSVGFSRIWLQDILRNTLSFTGAIFSDDLSMAGAAHVGGFVERAEAAQAAGCDMLLVCNDRSAQISVIDRANIDISGESSKRLEKLLQRTNLKNKQIESCYLAAKQLIEKL